MMLIADLSLIKSYSVSGADKTPSCTDSTECRDASTWSLVSHFKQCLIVDSALPGD